MIIHNIANVIIRYKPRVLHLPTVAVTPIEILNNPKFFPYFSNCIGALDGTHIGTVVPRATERSYRNRKGVLSQNVLACCTFNMQFTYVLAGWEGSAHDGQVLADAYNKGFNVPDGKFYLGDAGYGLSTKVITPYRGVRYHLKEWKSCNKRPLNPKELFNLRHSSLRNVIERVFGVTKNRFPLLTNMRSYPFAFQCQLIVCILTLHNVIRLYQADTDMYDILTAEDDDDEPEPIIMPLTDTNAEAEAIRDALAAHMWVDYQLYVLEHGL